mgnify:CR=1 FL=1
MATAQRNEIEAMDIIINIQMMQDKVSGEHFQYDQFSGNTIEELRNLQEIMIKQYNESFKK